MNGLILTAGIGGGHEVVGRALASELERHGVGAIVADGLRAMSENLHEGISRSYRNQARHAPALLAPTFYLSTSRAGAAAICYLSGRVYGEDLLDALDIAREPGFVVSTYPLVTAALGKLRRSGELQAPVVALVPDYGVHPLWVSPHADLHLVPSEVAVGMVERAGGRALAVTMPIGKGFRDPPSRPEARRRLGFEDGDLISLIVGGTLGIGDLERAARHSLDSGFCPVVVTGRNDSLRRRLLRRYSGERRVAVLGWTDEMPALMAASDVLIQNAGGMTCNEAISVGLPVVISDPIPGHGEFNARAMNEVGAARLVRGRELGDLLRRLASGEEPLMSAKTPERTATEAVLNITEILARHTRGNGERKPRPRRRFYRSLRRGTA